jgi:crossover junction endodeoxyribonuclease RusA
MTGPILLEIGFRLPRPKGHYGVKGLRPSAPPYPVTKPDLTKLLRALEDALKGLAWRDDSQVVAQRITKDYTDGAPGAHVRIVEL